jgi:hypothetical protein
VKPAKRANRQTKHAALFGVGLDNKDGHKRITTGEKFIIVGGSEETHERMTETLVKTFEELKQRGKPLEAVGTKELSEIINQSTPR